MKLTLQGGPADGREINAPEGCQFIKVPALFGNPRYLWESVSVTDPTPVFYVHTYNARTGIYIKGKMPTERLRIKGDFTWFSPRTERLLRWLDARRR